MGPYNGAALKNLTIMGVILQWFYNQYYPKCKVGNLIFTAFAIGWVTLRNVERNLQFLLARDILTLAWVSGLISIPDNGSLQWA